MNQRIFNPIKIFDSTKIFNSIKKVINIFRSVNIRTRILGLFLVIITAAITITTGITYSIGKSNLENMISNQLNNSVHSLASQISLLTSAYSSKEFSGKLKYVLASDSASYTQSGFDSQFYLLKSDGTIVDRDNINKETNEKSDLPDSFVKLAIKQKNGTADLKLNGKQVTVAYGYVVEKDWIYAVAVTKSSYLKLLQKQQIASIISGIISILLAFALSMLGTKGIIASIKEINKTVTAAGAGKLSIRSNAKSGGPEMLNLSNNLNTMLDSVQRILLEISNSIEELTRSSTELNEIAQKTDNSTNYVFSLTKKMSEDSQEQNSFTVQMAQSADKLIDTIEDVTNKVNLTTELSELMIKSAHDGMNTLRELMDFMHEISSVSDKTVEIVNILNNRSSEISKITNTITNISGQTKLLSLNASIEAARAGEYGQGFMVVASEIQNLAYSSSQSAVEVQEIIKDIRLKTDSALKVAERSKLISHKGINVANVTHQAFNDILDKVSQTHENVIEIYGKAENISENIKMFETNSKNILDVINQLASSSQEVAVEVEKHHEISSDVIVNAEKLLNVASNFVEITNSYTID